MAVTRRESIIGWCIVAAACVFIAWVLVDIANQVAAGINRGEPTSFPSMHTGPGR